MLRETLRFLRNGDLVEIEHHDPNETLLDYLRLREKSCGSKEGCCEGDCGACTVAIGRVKNDELIYEPINSCILLMGQLDGKDLITIDDLSDDENLHPLQNTMVSEHGSQCGFCTPGIVMSLFAYYHSGQKATRANTNDWLAGNLCRCTGYKPISTAAEKAIGVRSDDFLDARFKETKQKLENLRDGVDYFNGTTERFFASPGSVESLATCCIENPDAVIVSGNTDVGLWINKQMRDLPKIIYTGRAVGFDKIVESDNDIRIGAGASYADAHEVLAGIDPDLGELVRRIGSKQVRASGTVGGNIANGSPIGDMPPALIALGATIELRNGENKRQIKLEDFFIAYGKQDREPGEIVSEICIPRLKNEERFRAFKISKRFDQDISAVLGAFYFKLDGEHIADCRIAFGGMAATPKRASNAERILIGSGLNDENVITNAMLALGEDFAPLNDMRASAEYRLQVAKNLLKKAHFEICEPGRGETRLLGKREMA